MGGSERAFDSDCRVDLPWIQVFSEQHSAFSVFGSRKNAAVPVVDSIAERQLQCATDQNWRNLHNFQRFQKDKLPHDDVDTLIEFASSNDSILLQDLS